jgi:hypothetical protein
VELRPGAVRAGGVPIDLVELSVKWPGSRRGERRAYEWLFGRKLVVATAALGDRVVFTVGKDACSRVAQMVRVSRGGAAPSVREAPGFMRALRFHGDRRVAMAYLPLQPMSQFIDRLAHATDPQARKGGDSSLSLTAGEAAIVSTTNVTPGSYEVSTFVPTAVVGDFDAFGGALWRIGFQPLMNPPQVPPLPVPPSQLTPPVHSAEPSEDIDVPLQPTRPRPTVRPLGPVRPV